MFDVSGHGIVQSITDHFTTDVVRANDIIVDNGASIEFDCTRHNGRVPVSGLDYDLFLLGNDAKVTYTNCKRDSVLANLKWA